MPISSLRIIVLANDTADKSTLVPEHGLALWVEADNLRILFDTGQGRSLVPHARALGIDLASITIIGISHGHYDHTGGLAEVHATAPDAFGYCPTGALVPRYSKRDDRVKAIGMPPQAIETLIHSAHVR